MSVRDTVLEKDNPSHRNKSNNLDKRYKDRATWNKVEFYLENV